MSDTSFLPSSFLHHVIPPIVAAIWNGEEDDANVLSKGDLTDRVVRDDGEQGVSAIHVAIEAGRVGLVRHYLATYAPPESMYEMNDIFRDALMMPNNPALRLIIAAGWWRGLYIRPVDLLVQATDDDNFMALLEVFGTAEELNAPLSGYQGAATHILGRMEAAGRTRVVAALKARLGM